MKKDIVAGLGEIGSPIFKIISKNQLVVGYDTDKSLMNESKFKKVNSLETSFLHIAIPVSQKFSQNIIKLYKHMATDIYFCLFYDAS